MTQSTFSLFIKSIVFSTLIMLCGSFMMSCTTTASSVADKKAYAGNDDSFKKKFTAEFDEGEKPIRYGYYYIVTQVPEGYRVWVFHPDQKTLTEKKTYSTPNLTLLHGSYESYWDDGSIRAQGIYQYGRKHGMWVESEPGKGKSVSGMYFNQRKEGQWTQLDTTGLVESIFTWHDDQRHGKFFQYDAGGTKINEGIYRSDTLISELFKQPLITRPYLKNCEESIYADVYSCSDAMLTSVIYSNLKYPAKAKEMEIEGAAVVQWDVLPNGTVANVRIPQSISDEIEKECMRVIKLNDKWVPAYRDGKAVKYTFTLPINFKI